MPKTPEIRVRAKGDRFSFDGQTGVLILAGTPGTIAALTIHKGRNHHAPRLTVFWDYALVQDEANDEPTTTEAWQESEIAPTEIDHDGVTYAETQEAQ